MLMGCGKGRKNKFALAFGCGLSGLLSSITATPTIEIHHNASNIQWRRVLDYAQDGRWVTNLGTTLDTNDCGAKCIAWSNLSRPGVRCRNFVRYGAAFAKNSNISKKCFGHLDANWAPSSFDATFVDSGEVLWPCETALDCSLNGICGAGTCKCDAQWTGTRCQTLQLDPVGPASMGFEPTLNGMNSSSWGGSVMQVADQWHMWPSFMDNHCGISDWETNSRIVHAVAASPEGKKAEPPEYPGQNKKHFSLHCTPGPYTAVGLVAPTWAHG
jgi:hypothetical protein